MTRRYHLHPPTFIYLLLTLIVLAMAIHTQRNLLFWIFGVMLSGVLISGLVSGFMLYGVRCRRLLPVHGEVGEPLVVRYEVRNRGRLLPVFNVYIEELNDEDSDQCTWRRHMRHAHAWIMHIARRDLVHGEAVFWPTSRGEARFDRIRVWTSFPFGLVKKSVTISQPQHSLIYPVTYELRRGFLSAVTPSGPIGMKVSQSPGPGDDYYGVREYRPGDSMRHVLWKRAAGLDQLICVERTRPSPPRLRVVLSLVVPTDKIVVRDDEEYTARDLEERAISLAASIIRAADRAGLETGLTILGLGDPPTRLRRSHWHVEKIMAALAALDLDAERRGARRPPVTDVEQAGMIVIHPDRPDPSLGGPDAWHLTSRQMSRFVADPVPAVTPSTNGAAEPIVAPSRLPEVVS